MSHHVPGPPDYDVVMTEQVSGQNEPKMLGRHKPTAPYVGVLPIKPQSYYTSRLKKTQFQCTPWGYRKTIKMIENVNVIYINRKIIVS